MNTRKDISIRKFTLLSLIGLTFLIISNILLYYFDESNKTMTILIEITQVLGNLQLGIGLIGYFLHLKENRLLKWTSLFIGIFYILNIMAPDSIMPILIDEFHEVLPENAVIIYTIFIECIMIFFGISFTKLSKYNRAVGLFCILFVAFTSITFMLHIANITLGYNHQLLTALENNGFNAGILDNLSTTSKLLANSSLLLVFVFLFIRQGNALNISFNIQDLSTPDPEELKQIEEELKKLEEEHEIENKKES